MDNYEKVSQDKQELTVEGLAKLLVEHGIDISKWGTGSAKTIAHLYEEILEGESQMTIGSEGITRAVRIVWLDVLYFDKQGDVYQLIEERQEYRDGRTRVRNLGTSLGEKMKPNEDPDDAAIRALAEELDVQAFTSLHTIGHEQTTHTPDSYPGLKSNYDTYRYVAVLDDEGYNPEGYVEVQPDKTNYYSWMKVHSANS